LSKNTINNLIDETNHKLWKTGHRQKTAIQNRTVDNVDSQNKNIFIVVDNNEISETSETVQLVADHACRTGLRSAPTS